MLNKLSIKNFKCFRECAVNLSNLTVLVGENAGGKSTFIQAFLFVKEASKNSNEIFLNNHYGQDMVTASEIGAIGRDSDTITIQTEYDDKIKHILQLNLEVSKNTNKLQIIKNANKTKLKEKFENFYYLNTERIGPRVFQDIPTDESVCCGYKGEYTDYIILENNRKKISKFNDELFETVLEKLFNYVIEGISFKPSDEISRYNKSAIEIKKTKSTTEFLTPTNIGFGISYVLPIIVTLILAPKNSKIIIENPEVHLHPASQSKLGELIFVLSSLGNQIIIETHSEHILNGIRLGVLKKDKKDSIYEYLHNKNSISHENIIINYFKNIGDESKITEIKLNKYAEYSEWPSGFFDQEEIDLMKMINLRKNVR